MADKKVKYTFQYRGAYTGDVTGRRYLYRPDQSFVAPEGEFDGMDSSRYETRPLRPAPAASEEQEKPEEGTHHTGAGWYEVRVDGEVIDKIRGEEAAEALYQELTSEE